MSQENVDTARRVGDAANRRDVATLDSLWSEEGEFNSRLAASEGHVFRGRQGIRDYFAWLDEPFEEFRSEVEEIIDAGEDRVVALLRASVRGKASGVPLDDQRFAIVFTFQGERIARADSYFQPSRSPRSRRAVGIGDVAGERGDRPREHRHLQVGREGDLVRAPPTRWLAIEQ